MGRDDKQQSVGVFQHRLKMTPPPGAPNLPRSTPFADISSNLGESPNKGVMLHPVVAPLDNVRSGGFRPQVDIEGRYGMPHQMPQLDAVPSARALPHRPPSMELPPSEVSAYPHRLYSHFDDPIPTMPGEDRETFSPPTSFRRARYGYPRQRRTAITGDPHSWQRPPPIAHVYADYRGPASLDSKTPFQHYIPGESLEESMARMRIHSSQRATKGIHSRPKNKDHAPGESTEDFLASLKTRANERGDRRTLSHHAQTSIHKSQTDANAPPKSLQSFTQKQAPESESSRNPLHALVESDSSSESENEDLQLSALEQLEEADLNNGPKQSVPDAIVGVRKSQEQNAEVLDIFPPAERPSSERLHNLRSKYLEAHGSDGVEEPPPAKDDKMSIRRRRAIRPDRLSEDNDNPGDYPPNFTPDFQLPVPNPQVQVSHHTTLSGAPTTSTYQPTSNIQPSINPFQSTVFSDSARNLAIPKAPKIAHAQPVNENSLAHNGHSATPSKRPASPDTQEQNRKATKLDSRSNTHRHPEPTILGPSSLPPPPKAQVPHRKSAYQSASCPFLEVFPLEIRRLIYQHLLHTPLTIRGGELVEDACSTVIVPDKPPPAMALGIDSAFLRICRKVYSEALPILYQENRFTFTQVSMLRIFRSKGLPEKGQKGLSKSLCLRQKPIFGFRAQPQGRLSLLRNVHLKFEHNPRYSSLRGTHGLATGDADSERVNLKIQDRWADFLGEEMYDQLKGYVAFPALRRLVLDFSDWKLKRDEGLRIRAFVDKFRGKEGLRMLRTVGLRHEPTIELMRQRMLGSGGVMEVLPRNSTISYF